jgi:hypothetical protein
MPRAIFMISYPIKKKNRDEYLETVQVLKNYLTLERGRNYSVFEAKNKPNQFNEIYTCDSMEEYDRIEEEDDKFADQLIDKIADFIEGGKVEYRTLIESM